jgi:hypothetical protein
MMETAAAKAVSKALSPLMGGAAKELSNYLGDQIRFLRWKSAIRILEKAQKLCEDKKIDPKNVPIKFVVPFIESASLEDVEKEPILADMWASLFSAAVTRYQARHAVYVDVLKKLSSFDAHFIQRLNRNMQKKDIYSEPLFDPDLWNANDKREAGEFLRKKFHAREPILHKWIAGGSLYSAKKVNALVRECVADISWRVDLIPLVYDVAFYKGNSLRTGVVDLLEKEQVVDGINGLAALGLMEKFDLSVLVSPPVRAPTQDAEVRIMCSFAILSSLGYDFIQTCSSSRERRRKSKK